METPRTNMQQVSIKEQLADISKTLPEKVVLVAVSKTKPISLIREAYDAGQRVFGENKVQEMAAKWEVLPKDIDWHFIGHLQKNKVKYLAPFVSLIHGVDSFKTLKEIDKQAKKNQRVIPCLLQVKIAQETTKFGASYEETAKILSSKTLKELTHTKVVGLMGMASFTEDQTQIQKEFRTLKSFFDKTGLKILSMGMSGDYPLAIEEGTDMVRIGSRIFGKRN